LAGKVESLKLSKISTADDLLQIKKLIAWAKKPKLG
jgi:hypothetical protein